MERIELFTCFSCLRTIWSDDQYYEILHYKRFDPEIANGHYMIGESRKFFHDDCFEMVAGKEYCT